PGRRRRSAVGHEVDGCARARAGRHRPSRTASAKPERPKPKASAPPPSGQTLRVPAAPRLRVVRQVMTMHASTGTPCLSRYESDRRFCGQGRAMAIAFVTAPIDTQDAEACDLPEPTAPDWHVSNKQRHPVA